MVRLLAPLERSRDRTFLALSVGAAAMLALACADARADWRVGTAIGIGGAGITSQETLAGAQQSISRSESPGTIGVMIERQISDDLIVAVDHFRGFRTGPFSSGVGFTGATVRWYFRDPAPAIPSNEGTEGKSILLYKTFVPSVGLATGLGKGSISRDFDQVPIVSGAAVYIGIVFGADYQLSRGVVWRPEIRSLTSISSSPTKPTSLKFFSINSTFLFLW